MGAPPTTAAPVRAAAPARLHVQHALEAAVLVELNRVRREHGLAPLTASKPLAAAAAGHSREMASSGYFAHEDALGRPFWKRIETAYPSRGWSLWSVGENLLWSSPDVDAPHAIQLWLDSPEHRRNMLSPKWREVGLSAVHAESAPGSYQGLEVTIVTADFGVRR